MENRPNSAPVTPVELLTRQLRDWQTLKQQLEEAQGDAAQIAYCQAKIDDLSSDLAMHGVTFDSL